MNESSNMVSELTGLKARIATLLQEKEDLENKLAQLTFSGGDIEVEVDVSAAHHQMNDDKLKELEEENARLNTQIDESKPLLSAVADVQRANEELTAQESELLAELDLVKTELELLKKQEL